MSVIQLRTFPGLWIGRRTVVKAQTVGTRASQPLYRCGACARELTAEAAKADLRDVVIQCECGEYNQV